ncbi:MAG: hypothetical protein EH225_02845 [Calditrichaeota bacterium]|nr:hypothetical protein [Calditrichota bacterium]RQV93581.1 MAG: hypothetical protein EH221_09265 [bacterium]RQW06685.1 MAG: hypothetical protein EH225_02845 [Calditrichota bacterium]
MEKNTIYRHIPLAALFSTLGVVFPLFFHFVGLGSAFLPMFLPVIMGSLLVPPSMALTIAIVTPLVSFLFTGMPPLYPPILLLVLLELIAVSLISSYLHYIRRMTVWMVLITALLIDRLILFLFVLLLARHFGFPERFYSIGAVIYGLPGIIMILLVIPPALRFLKDKYPQVVQKDNR